MPRWSQDTYIRTCRFAASAHRGQTVPGSDLPYVLHVVLVTMEILAALDVERGRDEDLAVQCALLHDVLEDTAVTPDELRAAFGTAVADGVLALTKNDALPKHARLDDSLARIRAQPREVWMVKLADRITNLLPPPAHWTSDKIVAYRAEAVRIHESLKDGSAYLAERLARKIREYGVPADRNTGP